MQDALRLIIAKSPRAAREAIDCLRAISAKSPVVNIRYANTLTLAFNDPEAEFTVEERAILAEAIDIPESDTRSFMLRIRLTEAEHVALMTAADAAGLTVSAYVRGKVLDTSR